MSNSSHGACVAGPGRARAG